MNKILLVIILSFYSVSTQACNEHDAKTLLSELQWQTEDYPPFNFRDETGRLVGIFPEILLLAYQDLNISLYTEEIDIIPWARLLFNMKHYSKYAAFSMVTTKERAIEYQLLPLPFVVKSSIMVLKANKKKFKQKNLDELAIGVVRGDIGQALLDREKIKAFQVETNSALSMLKMLSLQRVDAIAYAEDVAYFQFNKLAIEKDSIVPFISLDEGSNINFVFHKSMPKCAIELLAKSIEKLHKQGKVDKIRMKYIQS
ncbi:substrate-binding periplasmic protein [Litorilituus lipolyticus]|uniref:Transporter substrate-binding domain-containing protein n=1 Tax=Litorilituus lipolyticus TaxID=2491017 RepID=A0A502LBE2_9GAMM|nr:transporter substrate-binding domain-containing protein [Litorilituus lipolyticus]TPH19293.1 transporter substrate-binding domain-containing protein [Litorilituus lipolyticus]